MTTASVQSRPVARADAWMIEPARHSAAEWHCENLAVTRLFTWTRKEDAELISLPPGMSMSSDPLEAALEDSRRILELQDDWDTQGAKGYSQATWDRAVNLVRDYANWLRDELGLVMPTPRILPGPDGSIDVHWEGATFELLINVVSDHGAPASFYGDDDRGTVIRGSFRPDTPNRGLLLWLASRK